MFVCVERAGIEQARRAFARANPGTRPMFRYVEEFGFETAAQGFALLNEVPYERLDLAVLQELTRLRTVEDVDGSALLYPGAKAAFRESVRDARASGQFRLLHTQGIRTPLVLPTPDELSGPWARADLRACPYITDGPKTMGAHPFFSTCVAHKFLVFEVSPAGRVALRPDMHVSSHASVLALMMGADSSYQVSPPARAARPRRPRDSKLGKLGKLDKNTARAAPPPPVPTRAVDRWRRALSLVRPIWRQDREERMRTAQNRVETRKRQLRRERGRATRAATASTGPATTCARSPPKVAWAEQAPGPSERATAAGAKATRLARREAALAVQHEARERREHERLCLEAERLRNLRIADSILYG